MFDELETDSSFKVEEVEKTNQNQQSYQNRSYNNNQSGNGYKGFPKKDDTPQDPYIPVGIFVDKEFPQEVKTSLYNIASKLIQKKYTVRVHGADKEFCDKVSGLSDKFVEVYLPWRMFNDNPSKHTFNTATSKEIARVNFLGWEKIPDSVKAILASQVRIIFGDRNNSIVRCLITWSKDGASRTPEITKDTGRSGFIIKVAATHSFPVINISKESSGSDIERSFGI